MASPRQLREVVFVDGVRTPFGKAGGMYANTRADDLVIRCIRELLRRNPQLPCWLPNLRHVESGQIECRGVSHLGRRNNRTTQLEFWTRQTDQQHVALRHRRRCAQQWRFVVAVKQPAATAHALSDLFAA